MTKKITSTVNAIRPCKVVHINKLNGDITYEYIKNIKYAENFTSLKQTEFEIDIIPQANFPFTPIEGKVFILQNKRFIKDLKILHWAHKIWNQIERENTQTWNKLKNLKLDKPFKI